MALSCNDICDLLVEKLLKVGFKIDTSIQDHHDIWKALNDCAILPPGNKVQVVIGLYQGVVDHLVVCTTKTTALEARAEVDEALNIERDPDGYYEHNENDCTCQETTLLT